MRVCILISVVLGEPRRVKCVRFEWVSLSYSQGMHTERLRSNVFERMGAERICSRDERAAAEVDGGRPGQDCGKFSFNERNH